MTQHELPNGEQPAPPAGPTAPAGRPTVTLKRLLLAPIAAVIGLPMLGVLVCACDFRSGSERMEARRLQGMKSVLRNLISAEEAYFADHVTYTNSLESLRFAASDSVTVTIGSATGIGWSATAKHVLTTKTCGIFVGNATAPIQGQTDGEPRCQ